MRLTRGTKGSTDKVPDRTVLVGGSLLSRKEKESAGGGDRRDNAMMAAVPFNETESDEIPFCKALDDLYEEGQAPFSVAVVKNMDDDTVAALEKADAAEPCKSICTEMMTMGYYDEEEMSRWNRYSNPKGSISHSPTKMWPLVVIDSPDYSDRSNNNIHEKKGRGWLPRRKFGGRFAECQGLNRFKPQNVDVVFADQDKYSTVYAIEVCSSTSSRLSDLYARQGLARF